MKKWLVNLLSSLVVIALLIGAIGGSAWILRRKSADERFKDFFQSGEEYDVLFFGTSHMIDAVFPMELWEDYGIVSYNLAGHGMNIPTSYWVMMNSFDYTTPKLVVIDCMLACGYGRLNPALSHLSLDAIPLSRTKIDMMKDLTKDEAEQMEYLSVFSIYHSRWNELSESDFVVNYSPEKGGETRNFVADVDGFSWSVGDAKNEIKENAGLAYINRMIEECQSRGIEVLLTYVPFPASEEEQLEANRVEDIAKEHGVEYINFLKLTDVIDYKTDCSDAGSHLNGSGARKVTDYLGEIMTGRYGIEDQRNNPLYAGWYEDYKDYQAFKAQNFNEQAVLDVYLSMMADKHYIEIINISDLSFTEKQKNLLKNLYIDPDQLKEGTYLLDYRNKTLSVFESNGSTLYQGKTVSIEDSKVLIDGKTISDKWETSEAGISLLVIESDDFDVADFALFDASFTRAK